MTSPAIWQTRHDGLTHRAVITGDDWSGYEVRSACGLTGNAFLEVKVHDLAEITCPACLALPGRQAPNNHTEREGNVNHSHPA